MIYFKTFLEAFEMQYGKDNLNPFSGLAIKFQTHVLTGQKISFLYILKPLNNLKNKKLKIIIRLKFVF